MRFGLLHLFSPDHAKEFYSLFSRHIRCTMEAVPMLDELLSDVSLIGDLRQKMKDKEHEGDRIAREAYRLLDKTFHPPYDREDISNLIGCLDDLLDSITSVSRLIRLFRIESIRPNTHRVVWVLSRMVEELGLMVDGIKGLKNSEVQAHTETVKNLEEEADMLYGELVEALTDDGVAPIYFIKWLFIFETLEKAADRGQAVADVISGIARKYAVE